MSSERSEAIAAGLTRYFTGKPCPKGHVSDRYTARCVCVECHRLVQAKAYKAKAPQRKKRIAAWAKQNADKVRGYKAAYKERRRNA